MKSNRDLSSQIKESEKQVKKINSELKKELVEVKKQAKKINAELKKELKKENKDEGKLKELHEKNSTLLRNLRGIEQIGKNLNTYQVNDISSKLDITAGEIFDLLTEQRKSLTQAFPDYSKFKGFNYSYNSNARELQEVQAQEQPDRDKLTAIMKSCVVFQRNLDELNIPNTEDIERLKGKFEGVLVAAAATAGINVDEARQIGHEQIEQENRINAEKMSNNQLQSSASDIESNTASTSSSSSQSTAELPRRALFDGIMLNYKELREEAASVGISRNKLGEIVKECKDLLDQVERNFPKGNKEVEHLQSLIIDLRQKAASYAKIELDDTKGVELSAPMPTRIPSAPPRPNEPPPGIASSLEKDRQNIDMLKNNFVILKDIERVKEYIETAKKGGGVDYFQNLVGGLREDLVLLEQYKGKFSAEDAEQMKNAFSEALIIAEQARNSLQPLQAPPRPKGPPPGEALSQRVQAQAGLQSLAVASANQANVSELMKGKAELVLEKARNVNGKMNEVRDLFIDAQRFANDQTSGQKNNQKTLQTIYNGLSKEMIELRNQLSEEYINPQTRSPKANEAGLKQIEDRIDAIQQELMDVARSLKYATEKPLPSQSSAGILGALAGKTNQGHITQKQLIDLQKPLAQQPDPDSLPVAEAKAPASGKANVLVQEKKADKGVDADAQSTYQSTRGNRR